jgi:hypothetical protein
MTSFPSDMRLLLAQEERVGRMRPQAVIRRMWRIHLAEGAALLATPKLRFPPC